jgi:hypothetical protein
MSKQVLFVTSWQQRAASLVDRIGRTGSRIFFAKNCKSARELLKNVKVDLVLSEIALPDGTADQFINVLEDSPVDIFFANRLDEGAWWLHVLIAGRNYWWKPIVLSPEQFSDCLDQGLSAKFIERCCHYPLICGQDEFVPITNANRDPFNFLIPGKTTGKDLRREGYVPFRRRANHMI